MFLCLCVSENSPEVHPLLPLLAPLSRKCVLKHTVVIRPSLHHKGQWYISQVSDYNPSHVCSFLFWSPSKQGRGPAKDPLLAQVLTSCRQTLSFHTFLQPLTQTLHSRWQHLRILSLYFRKVSVHVRKFYSHVFVNFHASSSFAKVPLMTGSREIALSHSPVWLYFHCANASERAKD